MPEVSATKRSTRRLSEAARHVIAPSGIVSTGWPAVEARLSEWGIAFDEWQAGAGKLILAKREGGEYAATVGGITLSIPRQVAKTFMVTRIVAAMCSLFPNLTVLWTAHHTRTTTMTFGTLRTLAANESVAPHVKVIRTANGEQEIEFVNGSRIMFGARERGFGRGFEEIDILVFDEAQILSERALDDMVATTQQSRFPSGALLFYMGTPPRPNDPGEVFKARRRAALAGTEQDTVYIECSADPDADPDDREQWAVANPSFPYRTPVRSMLRLRKNLVSNESWMREALGVWDSDQQGSRLITVDQWDEAGLEEPPTTGTKSFGVAFSFDGTRVGVAGGLKHADGVHVELIGAFSGHLEDGVSALAEWLAARRDEAASIVISGSSGASVLRQALKDLAVPDRVIHVATTTDYFSACSMFYDAVKTGDVTHTASEGQAVLDLSVGVCDKKNRGTSGAWGWASTVPGGDETPIEAVSLAFWAARTTKRNPARKVRAVF